KAKRQSRPPAARNSPVPHMGGLSANPISAVPGATTQTYIMPTVRAPWRTAKPVYLPARRVPADHLTNWRKAFRLRCGSARCLLTRGSRNSATIGSSSSGWISRSDTRPCRSVGRPPFHELAMKDRNCNRSASIDPIGREDVRLPYDFRIAIRREDQVLRVGGKHREAIECFVERDLLEARAVQIDQVHVEVALLRIILIRREYEPPAVRVPRRRKAGGAERCQLPIVPAVAIHHVELELSRPPQVFLQQRQVVVELGSRLQRTSAIRNTPSIP